MNDKNVQKFNSGSLERLDVEIDFYDRIIVDLHEELMRYRSLRDDAISRKEQFLSGK
jgi:hypothetical protein